MNRSLLFAALFAALALFAAIGAADAQVRTSDGTISISVPKAPWYLGFKASGFQLKEKKESKNGEAAYYFFVDEASGMNLSFFVEPAAEFNDAKQYRDMAWEKSRGQFGEPTDVVKSDMQGCATIAYTLEEVRGIRLNQRNVNAHFVKDGFWIDAHLSRVAFEKSEQPLFDALVNSLTFTPKTPGDAGTPEKHDALFNFQRGSAAYLQQDYSGAVPWYSEALAMEKKEHTLSDEYWHVLVDNLGMAQALTGNLEAARTTFSYGVSRDSTYPMFHYNLACTHAELGDMATCIANLRQAFHYRNNMLNGERLPDPRDDSSFKRYLSNDTFMKALKEMESGGK
ncbi:MAG TPA: hypothetical protein VHI13_22375 [Candidatus Kapabacteria bacterium]|nr:hypothetical protein [Candidatus Kapabacteria bacterium]